MYNYDLLYWLFINASCYSSNSISFCNSFARPSHHLMFSDISENELFLISYRSSG
ncbi:hypothetical protein BG20_I2222 [Candidatus Nitrosarchaeum limnium BG20]|uniref:Uncharacterized protein n=1 Tax=Candidatus Nitrosarchaeum limnium BG20 TaxID=859192 RepID=S2EPN1_9ARCH|nr:hypothetical protein BG20_I2222 [Candidatus Nitrosarchaeum limnium BG20]